MRLAPALAVLVDLELRREDLPAATAPRAGSCRWRKTAAAMRSEPWPVSRAARIAAHKGAYERALDELDTALTLLMHRDRPLLAAQVRLELARVLASAGEVTSAELEAEASLAAFGRLGAAPDVAAGNEFLEILRRPTEVAVQEGRATEHFSFAALSEKLTRREAEVAQVVAEGPHQPGDRGASVPVGADGRVACRPCSRQARLPHAKSACGLGHARGAGES